MIKKISLVMALVATITSLSFGQLKYGVKGGLNISNLKMTFSGTTITNQNRTGFMVGGFAVYSINDKISIQPELLFAQYGCKLDGEMWYSDTDIDLKQNYLSIPIMFNYSLGAITLSVGPQIGYLLSADVDVDTDGVDPMDFFNTMDFGITMGGAYEFENGFGIGARYYLGTSNIGSDDFTGGEGTLKSKAFQILASYKFQ